MNRYDESAYAARWMLVIVALTMIVCLASAFVVLARDAPWWVPVQLVAVGVILGFVEFLFMRLRIEVTEARVRFRFGPFGPTLKRSEIRSAEVVPYRWVAFGGWGIRIGRVAGRFMRAYSVPFLRTGVAIETNAGARYYVSSRRPELFAAAILAGRSREGSA
ncbi:MAG: hypothetical protein K1X87_11240 [Dehalococcoidia bacterium]|nr:hypothetical protein [Dehalococcoidia bacterium]HRC61967.1 hypothetical protein [Dehalococcoidia bacterium]